MKWSTLAGAALALIVVLSAVLAGVFHVEKDIKREVLLDEYRRIVQEQKAMLEFSERTGGAMDIALANIPPARFVSYQLILRPVPR